MDLDLEGGVKKAFLCAMMYPLLEVSSRVIPVGRVGEDLAYCREYVKGCVIVFAGKRFGLERYVSYGMDKIREANENSRRSLSF